MLKADVELCEIPVILMTVLGDRDMRFALGVAEHLTKPINRRELLRLSTTGLSAPVSLPIISAAG